MRSTKGSQTFQSRERRKKRDGERKKKSVHKNSPKETSQDNNKGVNIIGLVKKREGGGVGLPTESPSFERGAELRRFYLEAIKIGRPGRRKKVRTFFGGEDVSSGERKDD